MSERDYLQKNDSNIISETNYKDYSNSVPTSRYAFHAENAGFADEAGFSELANCATVAKSALYANESDTSREADRAKFADDALHATNAIQAIHANTADKASHAKKSDNSINANHSNFADQSILAHNAKRSLEATHAANADNALLSSRAYLADFAEKSKCAESIFSTHYFWLTGQSNMMSVEPGVEKYIQAIPIKVEPYMKVNVSRIRCSFGFLTQSEKGLSLKVTATNPYGLEPLDNSAFSTYNVVDEIPSTPIIYENLSSEINLIVLRVSVINEGRKSIQVGASDSWWIEIKID